MRRSDFGGFRPGVLKSGCISTLPALRRPHDQSSLPVVPLGANLEYTPLIMLGLLPIDSTKAIWALQRPLDFLTAIRGRCTYVRAARLDLNAPRMHTAIGELQWLVQQRYPELNFQVEPEDDPKGKYLLETVDVGETDTAVDVFIDRRLELQIDDGLAVYIWPVRPLARVQPS
jgi:hypothetical protein